MCGIGGILRFDGEAVSRGPLEAMLPHLRPRGPDGEGLFLDGPIGLVHTRLAVTDPAHGHQPMTRGRATLVYNGQIYNHRDLRRQLADRCLFTTDHCDTEALMYAYQTWPDDLAGHLAGMYAMGIWDGERRRLVLGRDPFGKKPLYLHHDARRLIFASTLGALRAAMESTPPIDREALAHYLTFGYTDERTLLTGVTELSPSIWLIAEPSGDLSVQPVSAAGRRAEGAATIAALLGRAVERRLEADVELGCFLSGGIDSSLIAAIAAKRLQRQGRRLKTFTVSMPVAKYDEGPFARRVAEHIGSDHHELTAEADVEADLRRLIAFMGEPFGDSSLLPTYWLSRAARQHVTVALSGDGGDEMFAGYERYRAMRLLRRHGWWLRHLPAGLLGGGDQKATRTKLRRLISAARSGVGVTVGAAGQYLDIVRLFTPTQLRELGVDVGNTMDRPPGWADDLDAVDAARSWDMTHYLRHDLLRKVDRASMAVALEVRCPMLDDELAAHVAARSSSDLMPAGRPKGLLRDLAEKHLPADIVHRPKMGFAVPIGVWFAGELRPMLERWLLDAQGLASLGFSREALRRLIADHAEGAADHTQRLFTLLSLAMWMDWTMA